MLIIYGSEMCPDCRQCRANFDACGIEYEVIDINASLANLKEFLRIRDKYPVFDQAREAGGIGIPALAAEDGTIFLDWEGYMKEKGFEPLPYEAAVQACSLDRKGC